MSQVSGLGRMNTLSRVAAAASVLLCMSAWGQGTGMAPAPAAGADPCSGFSWNVTHERAIFATPATPVMASTSTSKVPTLAVDKLYEVTLAPQNTVSFALPPAKKTLADGAFAGLVTLHIPSAGKYRVAMSEGFWIDVIAAGAFAPTEDFTGSHECRAPRKIVQYPLPAGDWVLQFSNTNSASVRVTVTEAPK